MKLDESWQRYHDRGKRWPGLAARYDLMVDLVNPPSVLDVGCGQCLLGYLLFVKRPEIKRVVGLDRFKRILTDGSQRMQVLTDGGQRIKNLPVEFKYGYAENLPFEGETFATVVLCEILEHVVSTKKAVGEALRVLQEGGRLITSVPVELHRSREHKWVFHDVGELTSLFGDEIVWQGAHKLHRWYFAWGDKH